MNKLSWLTFILVPALILAACASPAVTSPAPTTAPPPAELPQATAGKSETLAVMTHDSFAVSQSVLDQFQNENNITVSFLEAGDTGTALNKAILSKSNPLADVFYGVDNTFLSRALNEGIFEPYDSPVLSQIPDKFKLDPQNQALPVDYGDVCLNYQKSYFQEMKIPHPNGLEDLLKPEYKGLLVVENPATSSPGLAFMLATIGHFGEDNWLDYWKALVENDVTVVNDWTTAYYTEFSQHGGTHPIVVSYGSSPPFEVIDAEQPVEEPPTVAIVSDTSCFRQIEFVGILKGTQNRALAEKWVDFMLSPTFQEDIPLQMFVFPVNENAKLNETFQKYLAIPEETAQVSPDAIAQNREKWIQEWTETVLR
ncbi:MAG TPA: thiamine ABC transporter substrate-binding protein [Anaerolineales bacterium]|nr:thiamine ABC transporter substrate-binding protein [Anaerolineales bacterium]